VRLPAGDRTMFAFGATWSPINNLDIDASYMYIQEKTVRVNQQTTSLVGNLPIEYSAKFDNSVNLLSLQATWKF
jgi:long-chain fatty acid transport protein